MSIFNYLDDDELLFKLIHEADDDTNNEPDDNGNDTGQEDDADEFSLDDNDNNGSGDDTTGGDNDEGDNEENTEDNNNDGEQESDDSDEFSMDDDEGNDGEDTGNAEQDSSEGTEDSGLDDNEEGSGEDQLDENDPNYKLRALEKSIFDQLSPEQQAAKLKELKSLFSDTYKKSQDIMNMITSAEKDPRHAKVYEYVINTLSDLQKFIRDYLANMFDSKTYIENMTELQKYLTLLDTINNLFADIKNDIDNRSI